MVKKNSSTISRDKLIHLFNSFSDERIIYVCAPAGYGKTVSVRQWLDGSTRARAVITLDEYDNNPMQFCERFCAALCSCQPQNAALSEITSHPAFGGAPDEFAMRAVAALTKRKSSVFVIDDVHFIHDERVLCLLLVLLKRLPDNFQIVLISRSDLPPGFSDLWMKGHLARITAEQIRFSSEEIVLLHKKRGSIITSEQAEDIYRFTNGWAIGINALQLSGGEPSGESLKHLEGFIRSNLWEKWDEDTREFMLNTAAARKLNPSLCTALTGINDSEKLLEELMRRGAFIHQSSDGVYRYHNLFHSFLKNMLAERGEEYLFSLLGKEGEWHLSERDFYSAMKCFIKCRSYEWIAKCFESLEAANRNDFIIEKMLPVIQTPEVHTSAEKYPSLFPSMAWAAFAEGRAADVTVYLDKFYARYPEIAAEDPARPHNIFFMRILDFREPLRSMENAVTKLSVASEAGEIVGSITMHLPMLHRSTRDFSELAVNAPETNVARFKKLIGWLFGTESDLLAECITAGLLYEQGLLDKAHTHALAANAEIKKHFASESKFSAMAIYICILDAQGLHDEAEQVLSRLMLTIEQDRAYFLNRNLNALTIRRKLGNGDIKAAWDWLVKYETAPHSGLTLHGMYETFTTCRAYIAIGNYDSAIILLTKLLELAQSLNRPLDIIETKILLAIAYWKKKRGFQREAMRHLEEAVSQAYNFGYSQIFANEGAELTGMMRRLQKSVEQRASGEMVPASYIKMLHLKTLENQNSGLTSGQAEKPVLYTDKQKTVMRLICDGRSYREIAEFMGIKLPTLRSHIALIYKKLDVTSETDAIKKIKSTGLLEEA